MNRRSWATSLVAALMMAAFAFPVLASGGSEKASASGPGHPHVLVAVRR